MSGLEPAVLAERMMAATIETAGDFQSLISPKPTSADSLRPYPFFLASPMSSEPHGAWLCCWTGTPNGSGTACGLRLCEDLLESQSGAEAKNG